MTPVEFRGDLWHQKTRVPEVSCGVVCVIVRLAILVEHRLVPDRRTDGQTDGRTDRQTQGLGNYVSIFYRFRDIADYLSKVADFYLPHLHLAPP